MGRGGNAQLSTFNVERPGKAEKAIGETGSIRQAIENPKANPRPIWIASHIEEGS